MIIICELGAHTPLILDFMVNFVLLLNACDVVEHEDESKEHYCEQTVDQKKDFTCRHAARNFFIVTL